ncbi:MAG: PEP-CTERM sorting domain-containing protein [Alphaproteobacteria bacterium]|nr:PEP-CTERM sorting domain-containing protein [Alphaproteobacteria bacterium]
MQLKIKIFTYAAISLIFSFVLVSANSAKAELIGFDFETNVDLTGIGLGNSETLRLNGAINTDKVDKLTVFGNGFAGVSLIPQLFLSIPGGLQTVGLNMTFTIAGTTFVSGNVFEGYGPSVGLFSQFATSPPFSSTKGLSFNLRATSIADGISLGDLLVSRITLEFLNSPSSPTFIPGLEFPTDTSFLDNQPNLITQIKIRGFDQDDPRVEETVAASTVSGSIAVLVPEPSVLVLFGIGLLGIGVIRHR